MKYLFLAIGLLSFLYFGLAVNEITEAQVPVRPEQPHGDIFEAAGIGPIQHLNPLSVLSKANRTSNYRLITMGGCNTGSVPNDMQTIERELAKVGYNLVRNDSSFNFTIRINCGTEQIRLCGAVNIFCLGRGFPFNPDVEISDIISTYPAATRISILCHEVCGHAIGTWNEQYCLGTETSGICKGLAQFASAPSWVDFMNTGPNSRHGIETIEIQRWERTMYLLTIQEPPACTGATDQYGNVWNPCIGRWVNPAGWTYDPVTMIWYQPNGTAEWGACNVPDNDCWHIPGGRWIFRGSTLFDPVSGQWFGPPLP